MGICHCGSDHGIGSCEIRWQVPKTIGGCFYNDKVAAAAADQHFCSGQEVTRCLAIAIEDVSEHLKAFCYGFDDQWLMPLGHAILFGRAHAAPSNLQVLRRRWAGRDVLCFVASRDIRPGEALCVNDARAGAGQSDPCNSF
eukprot:Skav202469  [mRNA]  locus=scaffold149:526236:527259:+ [translate_table: standard]